MFPFLSKVNVCFISTSYETYMSHIVIFLMQFSSEASYFFIIFFSIWKVTYIIAKKFSLRLPAVLCSAVLPALFGLHKKPAFYFTFRSCPDNLQCVVLLLVTNKLLTSNSFES